MKTRDVSFTIALCASLAVHAALVRSMADRYVISVGAIWQPGFPRESGESVSNLLILPRPIVPADESLGKDDGEGLAIDDAPGETELQTKRTADVAQPWLSRDPSGAGKSHAEPSRSILPPGNGGEGGREGSTESANSESANAQSANVETADPPESRALPFGVTPTEITDGPGPALASASPVPTGVASAQQPSRAPSPPAAPAPAPARDAQAGVAGAPGASQLPADPAPQAETESDAFSTIGSVEFRPGSTRAQLGRPHKLTYPRIDLGGIVDSVPLGRMRCGLLLTIDRIGHVTNVRVVQPSGSSNIDQACRIAAYEWWFQPKNDKNGQPRASETFLMGVEFR